LDFAFSFAWAGVLQVGGLCVVAALFAGFFPRRVGRPGYQLSEALRFE